MTNTNTMPDPYRDNEANVRNFADHIRDKAALEQMSVRDMASREISRFRDVTFGVNTQYGGSQLRLRDSDGKVITKLKKGAKINILNSSVALDSPDNDRGQGPDDSHIFVLVEANAADTEAGGKEGEKVQGWVSTEYIQQLGEPEPIPVPEPLIVVVPPVAEEDPADWEYRVPEPPVPREPNTAVPDATEPEPREPNTAVPDATVPEPRESNNSAVPDGPAAEPRESNAAVPDGPAKKPEGTKSEVPDGPKPEKTTNSTPSTDDKKETTTPGDSLSGMSTWENLKNWFLSWGNASKKSETPAQTVEPKATDTTTPTTESGNTKKDIPVAD